MNLNILEAVDSLHVPVRIADVILTQRILDQVRLVLNLHRVHFWNNDDLTELAKKMLVVGKTNHGIVLELFVHLEVLVGLANDELADLFIKPLVLRFLSDLVLITAGVGLLGAICSVLTIAFILIAIARCFLLLLVVSVVVHRGLISLSDSLGRSWCLSGFCVGGLLLFLGCGLLLDWCHFCLICHFIDCDNYLTFCY